MASFELTEFVICPSLEQFDKGCKVDLLLIVDFFDVEVPRTAPKRDIKLVLESCLVRDGILPETGSPMGVAMGSAQCLPVAEAADESEAGLRIDPTMSLFPGVDHMLAVELKELELEINKQECETELLRVKAVQIEVDKEMMLMRMSMGPVRPVPLPQKLASPMPASPPREFVPVPKPRSPRVALVPTNYTPAADNFDASHQIGLVPVFRENEVDAYFPIFERIATSLRRPKDLWLLMLQCKLVDKAQEVCSLLTLTQSSDYEVVKYTVLRAYELDPEAYRQNFRWLVKTPNQTFTEFAREKLCCLKDVQPVVLSRFMN
ncbi:hypothetical protein P4O66_003016 [Electrophorus voltai]|uniref:SCAN box domain-containing protein n=1 Tax=Electrophorus voltai TaxID=2609070 RepID=A0AAD8YSS0_9TELE|nr:hypothetical protein P4O66_003016 [Electrophorus voltai]